MAHLAIADPAMVHSQDKLSVMASALRLAKSTDREATLRKMGFADCKNGRLGKLNLPSYEEVEKAFQEGQEGIAALLREKGLEGTVPNFSISPETVRHTAATRSKSIFKNFRFLGSVLDRHEATIHRRWLKKSTKQRRKILQEAWGSEMALSHRPDFDALEREDEWKRWKATDYHDAYLWPYINEEDLLKPRSLLLLMSTRSRCHPSDLAAGEYESHRLGRGTLAFKYGNPGSFLLDLVSQGDEDSYGRMWNFKTHPEVLEACAPRNYTVPHHGLLVLEAQERVTSFLVNCVKLLLHDLYDETMLQGPPAQPESTLHTRSETEYLSLASVRAEAPYQHPASLDFGRVAALLAATYDHAADNLWSLREDPGYFEAQMLDSGEYRGEHILDSRQERHPVCNSGEEDRFWTRVIGDHLGAAHFKLEAFADLLYQAEMLRHLQSTQVDTDDEIQDLAIVHATLMLNFQNHLNHIAGMICAELCARFHASPRLRPYSRRARETDPAAQVTGAKQYLHFKGNAIQERIHWLLLRLEYKDELYQMIGITNIVDELQRLIDVELDTSLITSYLKSYVGDLAILSECLHQLEIYQPFAEMHGKLSDAQHAELERMYAKRVAPWLKMVDVFSERDCALGRLGAPTDGRFAYPVAKRRTRENVELMRNAEKNLDEFWRHIDQETESRSLRLEDGACDRLFTQDRTLQRTPEWAEPVRESVQPAVRELYVPFSQLFVHDQSTSDSPCHEDSRQQPKEKIKTRKPGNLEIPAAEEEAADELSEADSDPHFVLNARAHKVFKTLFFSPSTTSTPGEVAWADFLYAMVAVGFVPEKLYGSVWQFSPDPDKLAVERSIQFHEPHGAGTKIVYRIARRHGRRLNRAYGWDGSSFTLEERTKQ
jgi:hypothetical protein